MMPGGTTRVDVELVSRGLARSRSRAADLVAAGRVRVEGSPARKPSQPVGPEQVIDVLADGPEFVSRAGHKLDGALAALASVSSAPPTVEGARCLDVGASTGGFTQVLLERGAEHVVAVDVGHGQMDPVIADDPRVTLLEGVNARDLTAGTLPGPRPALVVADLSFISLTLVLAPLLDVAANRCDLLVMVKPQFEVGRERLGNEGVVTSPGLRAEAVAAVARCAQSAGARVRAVVPSGVPGESGNREYFLWLTGRPTDAPVGRAGPEPGAEDGPSSASPEVGAGRLGAVEVAVRRAVTQDRVVLLEEVG